MRMGDQAGDRSAADRREAPRVVACGITRSEGRALLLPSQNLDWIGPSVVAVTGSNGSGKSTLLRTLAGLTRPTAGTVTIDGMSPTDRPIMAATAYLPDSPVTFLDMSVEDQCTYVARLHGLAEVPPWTGTLREVLRFGPELDRRLPLGFSKGERQKASILLHLSRPHRLLILDEPTTGLDVNARAAFARWLTDHVRQNGVLVVVATHDKELIEVAHTNHRLDDQPSSQPDSSPP